MKKALVIIDVQNDYFPGGKWELYKANEALTAIKKLVDTFREQKLPIIFVQHVVPKGGIFFEVGTEGVQIHSKIAPIEGETVIEKHYPSSFRETKLQDILQENGIDELYICGMMTHMCVDTTVRAAKDLGYEVTLFEDACTTRDLEWKGKTIPAEIAHNAFMAALDGMFATVTTTDSL